MMNRSAATRKQSAKRVARVASKVGRKLICAGGGDQHTAETDSVHSGRSAPQGSLEAAL